jgi:hypothetical protein
MLPQKITKETCKFGTQQNFHVKRQFFFYFSLGIVSKTFLHVRNRFFASDTSYLQIEKKLPPGGEVCKILEQKTQKRKNSQEKINAVSKICLDIICIFSTSKNTWSENIFKIILSYCTVVRQWCSSG